MVRNRVPLYLLSGLPQWKAVRSMVQYQNQDMALTVVARTSGLAFCGTTGNAAAWDAHIYITVSSSIPVPTSY